MAIEEMIVFLSERRQIMKNKAFSIFIIVLVVLAASLSFVACDLGFKSDSMRDGVYLLSAQAQESAEDMPSDWVAIINEKMTVSENGNIKAYNLRKDKECYTAVSAEGSLSVILSGDKLTIDNNGQKTEYSADVDYRYSENTKESLIPVFEPEIVEENGKTYVSLTGEYKESLAEGISAEIKTPARDDYKSFAVVKNEDGELSIEIPSEEFVQGDNIIRLSNSQEYPMIDADKNLFMKTRSGSIEYKVTVDGNGNITYLQNDTALENGVYKFAYSSVLNTKEEKDYCYFVIIDGLLKESYKGGRILYYLSDADGIYSMKIFNPENTASSTFTVKNGIITVTARNSGKVSQFKKDEGYTYQEESEKLEKPVNPTYTVDNFDSKQYIRFRFFALDTYYPVGVRTEIKRAGSEDYEFYDIDIPYRVEIIVDGIGADKFDPGFNFIRICNVGAPVSTNDKHYHMTEDSEYIEFIVLLDETGCHIGPYMGDLP